MQGGLWEYSRKAVFLQWKCVEVVKNVKVQVLEELEKGKDLSNDHTSKKGTVPWMAPEMLNTNYDKSVGVFFIRCGHVGVDHGTHSLARRIFLVANILMAVVRGERPEDTKEKLAAVPEGDVELMHQCWAGNPKSRPSFNVVLMKLRHIKDQQSIYLSY